MTKKIFKTFYLLLISVFLLFGKDINAQDCATDALVCVVYVYESPENDTCTTLLPGLELHFWTLTPNADEFWQTSDGNGIISHNFTYPCQQWFMQATHNLPCGEPCKSNFGPINLQCMPYRYECESTNDCYCTGWHCPGGDLIIENGNMVLTHPIRFNLYQNYPNPFNPVTNITFDLVKAGYAKLTVYDISGKEIQTLIDGIYDAGSHSIEFNAGILASGLYFYKLETGEFTDVKKMLLIK